MAAARDPKKSKYEWARWAKGEQLLWTEDPEDGILAHANNLMIELDTVWKSHFDLGNDKAPYEVVAGPVYRMVADLRRDAWWVVDTGTSGWPKSPHYGDQCEQLCVHGMSAGAASGLPPPPPPEAGAVPAGERADQREWWTPR